jgi:hypothetical protein
MFDDQELEGKWSTSGLMAVVCFRAGIAASLDAPRFEPRRDSVILSFSLEISLAAVWRGWESGGGRSSLKRPLLWRVDWAGRFRGGCVTSGGICSGGRNGCLGTRSVVGGVLRSFRLGGRKVSTGSWPGGCRGFPR